MKASPPVDLREWSTELDRREFRDMLRSINTDSSPRGLWRVRLCRLSTLLQMPTGFSNKVTNKARQLLLDTEREQKNLRIYV